MSEAFNPTPPSFAPPQGAFDFQHFVRHIYQCGVQRGRTEMLLQLIDENAEARVAAYVSQRMEEIKAEVEKRYAKR